MHGSLFMSRCVRCGEPFEDRDVYETAEDLPRCGMCDQPVRPHIVWFGEVPLDMEDIYDELYQSTVMLVVGTSGSVYPAAGLVEMANEQGIKTVYVGPEEPLNAHAFDEIALGTAAGKLPGLVG